VKRLQRSSQRFKGLDEFLDPRKKEKEKRKEISKDTPARRAETTSLSHGLASKLLLVQETKEGRKNRPANSVNSPT